MVPKPSQRGDEGSELVEASKGGIGGVSGVGRGTNDDSLDAELRVAGHEIR